MTMDESAFAIERWRHLFPPRSKRFGEKEKKKKTDLLSPISSSHYRPSLQPFFFFFFGAKHGVGENRDGKLKSKA